MELVQRFVQTSPLSWRTLALGDWGRVVRDPLDVMRLAYAAGAAAWVLRNGAAWDGLVGASLLLLAARFLNLPRAFDLSLILALTITGWGSALHLYGNWGLYDNVVHAVMPVLVTPVAYILLVRLGVLPELRDLRQPHHQVGFFLIAFSFGLAISGAWEVVEWLLDQWTGTHRVKDAADTANDLISGLFGSAGAGAVLVAWSLLGWRCTRLPAEAVRARRDLAQAAATSAAC